jgi:hypothetical protein
LDNIYVTTKNLYNMNYLLETSLTEIIKQIKLEYPYDNSMCRSKYNESIQDYLYQEIISNL